MRAEAGMMQKTKYKPAYENGQGTITIIAKNQLFIINGLLF